MLHYEFLGERSALGAVPLARWALVVVGVVTLARVIGLIITPLDLHGDEAQYWVWAQTLDWGYFSKPPLIAWVIAGATAVFGDAEWSVRLAAPLAHAVGALALGALARRMYGEEAGFWASLGWIAMPGVWLSASIISTDALLLPIWSIALYGLWRFGDTGAMRWALCWGAALGAGLLAKYAMGYFALGAAIAAVWLPGLRRRLLSRAGAVGLGCAALILAPNLAWNAANAFATIGHTAANANLGAGVRFAWNELLQFFTEQMGVFGPIPFLALLGLLFAAARAPSALDERQRFLIAFILPPLLIIMTQAFLSRAHANWAAAAYPAATVLLAGLCAQTPPRRWTLIAANAMHGVVGIVFLAAATAPGFADAIGLADAFKRTRQWEETAQAIAKRAAAAGPEGYSAIVVDNRLLYNDLAYYWRDGAPAPLRMWLLREGPHNHAEASAPMTAADGARALIVGATPVYEPLIAADFAELGPIEALEIPLGGGEVRRLTLREASGFSPAPRPAHLR